MFERRGAQFEGITVYNYGQILVADCQKDFIDVLSEDGVLQRNLLNNRKGYKIIYCTNHITLVEYGFLWVSGYEKITFFLTNE